MTRSVSVRVGVVAVLVMSVLAAVGPPASAANAAAGDTLVVETRHAGMTASTARAADTKEA